MTNKKAKFILVIILILAAFLRLWGSWRTDLFTYDQARDATYIRRIFTEGKIPLVGPQSSIPGVSLGPGYYYLMALPLLVSNFEPLGIDIVTGVIGVLSVWLLYKTLVRFTKKDISLAVSLLFAVSPIVVELTRRAWNLSTLPFFFIAVVSLLADIKEEKRGILFRFILLFALLGLSIQLHYSALLFYPPVFLILIFLLRKRIRETYPALLLGLLVFFILNVPIIFFNFRHNWIMSRSILTAFGRSGGEVINWGSKVSGFFVSIWHLFEGTFLYQMRPLSFVLFFGIIVASILGFIKRKTNFICIVSSLIMVFGILGAQFYPEGFSFFYFIFLLPGPFFLLALFFDQANLLFKQRQNKWIIFMSLPAAVWLFYQSSLTILRPPIRTRLDFTKVSEVIVADLNPGVKFNLAAIYRSTGEWENYYRRGIVREDIRWDHNAVDYGYFIEKMGFKPLPWDNFYDAQVLYLIAETEVKDPLLVKFWEIETFAPKKVTNQWQISNGTTVYKLER